MIPAGNGQLRSGNRCPREIISHCVWLYHRFALSFRDVEDLLAERGVILNLFNLGRHQLRSANYRLLRERSFKEWSTATAA